ncbi:saccharopine dehydrogenase-like oxidoreductase [Desertifilum sp. FACHB-1129]|uniref:(S)-8-amino-7-oxononanoate synthase BioU n=1 Tax=Desertifilum tharense IPPAS B-1220 TaxID=1781255 RepID=A0A1E5QQM8_9CYAN|nr:MULTISPECIES: saccharopine dehydrogenase-like oxidoreductase [Desertifilum]MDA0209856.1 saccharopine dehydrogenase-like oxidoreductase [Cyanobacteria bacterium FC1]MBD2310654.1 saccharopine dehydrogenase-like oxidoreductase [Desertifilum sp. FACHB-1129]MBD2320691.1 saccharopine dehydrogenase-like oxidoreductase [Desertifilum sp. FACHB-866]MBD2330819.1 saccharopine dehydrogenase-like oxidoreductase [Desertifilum sp. FACHB-868]OEJ76633.1 saccharopine dehydrogenase-like oxidoreductase [Deserti
MSTKQLSDRIPVSTQVKEPLRVGILGFGGLGQAAAKVLAPKQEMIWVAAADQKGYAYQAEGLDADRCASAYRNGESLAYVEAIGVPSQNSIEDLIRSAQGVNGYFLALPNLPNTFMADVARLFIRSGWRGVLVDALKRTSAVEQLLELQAEFQASGITYMTGCGATPGLLTAAASLAAQSYAEVHSVKITFGVGIANWEAYRATIREDIAHMPGYDVEKARAMTDAEVEALLDRTNGILALENMEHADDIMLELAGICDRDRVTVGGVVDTRNPKKPLSTNVQITGRTFEGKISTHTFTLGDETSMAANVCGPAFGYLKAGTQLHQRGIYGLFTAAEVMPLFVR